jgi:hypothetical protein
VIRYRTADGSYVSAEITVNEDGGLGLPVGAVADIVSEQRYNQLIAMGIEPDAASGTSGWNPGVGDG